MDNKPQFIPLFREDLKIMDDEGQHAIMLANAALRNSDFIADVLLSVLVESLTLASDEDDPFTVLDRLVEIIGQAKAA